MDLTLIAALIPSLLSLLFGGGDEQTTTSTSNNQTIQDLINTINQTTTTTTPNTKYTSPAVGLMDPTIISSLIGNMQSLSGAGMPGGKSRLGAGTTNYFNDILALLGEEWPTIMAEYRTPSKKASDTAEKPVLKPSLH